MQTTSDLYKQLLAQHGHTFELQIEVREREAGPWADPLLTIPMSNIWDLHKVGDFGGTGLFAGKFAAQRIELVLVDVDSADIPRCARLTPQIRAVGADGETVSEWIDIGVFFVDNRSWDPSSTCLSITAYDRARQGDKYDAAPLWQYFMQREMDLINYIGQLGVDAFGCSVDSGSLDLLTAAGIGGRIDNEAIIGNARDTIARFSASAMSNAVITASDKLRLVPIYNNTPVATYDGEDVSDLGTQRPAINSVVLVDSRGFPSGADAVFVNETPDEETDVRSRITVEGSAYKGDNAISHAAGTVWGVVYQPIALTSVEIDPALELGDVISSDGITWQITSMVVDYGKIVVADISAPGGDEEDHEYLEQTTEESIAYQALRDSAKALTGLEDKLDADLDNLSTVIPVSQGGTGQSAARVTETVTYDTSVASAHSVHVRHYPYLGMCFVRASFVVTGQDVAANTFFTAAAVDASLAPASTTALSVSVSGGGLAVVNSSGQLRVAFAAAQTAAQTRYVYVSGWWIQQTT